jgi:L-asparagine oxygenase
MDFKKIKNHIPILQIQNDEFETLKFISEKINTDPSESPELFCSQVKSLSFQIPKRIQTEFLNFKNNHFMPGILIKGIFLEESELPQTPTTNNERVGEKTLLAKIQALFLNVISEMVAYEAEGYGRLFQDIVPVELHSETQTSLGSAELEIHTEQAFSKLKPDILSLACLKGDSNAFTYILPIESIVEKVSFQEYCLLRKPLWNTGVDLSFKLNGIEFLDGDVRGPLSIINGSASCHELIFDQDLMAGLTEESENMIQTIVDIYYKERFSYSLVPGDILFINNNKAVHGRSSFSPKYDGNDRFLIRCFGTYDYKKSEYARPNHSRTIAAIYS